MDIKHDKLLDIATGTSRKTKTWKNKPVQWSDLLDRLSNTTRTPETVAECPESYTGKYLKKVLQR